MESLFKKYRKKPESPVENGGSGFNTASKYYLFAQNRWTRKMEGLTSRLSRRKLLCLLGLFVFVAGGTCIYSISKPFFNTACNSISIIPISKPLAIIND